MKKLLFFGFALAGLLLGACRETHSHGEGGHQHAPGEPAHQEQPTAPADATDHGHEHAPGDTSHQH